MSAQTASGQRPGEGEAHEKAPRALRILGLVAVCLGVAAIAAATFVLSYSGIHALALQARIAPRLARGYPLLIDAMLVVVLAAVLALRGAGLPSKIFAWVTLLAVLAAAAAADALHAAGRKLPGHVAAVTVAVVPWVLVFLAFGLLLAMLRYARIRRQAPARGQVTPHGEARAHWQPGDLAGLVPPPPAPTLERPHRRSGTSAAATSAGGTTVAITGAEDAPGREAAQLIAARPGATVAADGGKTDDEDRHTDGSPDADTDDEDGEADASVRPVLAVPCPPGPAAVADAAPDLGVDGSGSPDLAGDESVTLDAPALGDPVSAEGGSAGAVSGEGGSGGPASDDAPSRSSVPEEADDPEMPVFHRMWSAPTPPTGQ